MSYALSVGATNLATLAIVTDYSGMLSGSPPDAAPIVLPHSVSAIFVASIAQPYSWDLPLSVVRDTEADLQTALGSLRSLLDSSTTALALTRTIGATSTSSQGVVTSAWQPQLIGRIAAKIPVVIMNISGGWA